MPDGAPPRALASPASFKLAPRVVLYPAGSRAPELDDGWLALGQLASEDGVFVFGDGSHPTTKLCAGVLDFICRQRCPEAVLDVGTGTGILARIARARGSHFVAGTDIDPAALSSAETHGRLDGASIDLHFGAEAPDFWGARFDVVVANILEEPLRALASALARAMKPGGTLLLSGFTRPQTPALGVFFEKTGLSLVSESHLGEWALLRFERIASSPLSRAAGVESRKD